MLTDIRQFGLERADKDGELQGMQERHATWYGELVSRFDDEVCGPDQPDWLRLLRLEQANLRAALTYFAGAAEGAAAGLVMARKLDLYWSACGLLDEARHWLDLTLASGRRDAAGAGQCDGRGRPLRGPAERPGPGQGAGRGGHHEWRPGSGDTQALGVLLVPDAMLAVWDGAPEIGGRAGRRSRGPAAGRLRPAG